MWLSVFERFVKPYLMLETKECEREEVMSHQNGWKIGLTFMSEICLDKDCRGKEMSLTHSFSFKK